MTKSALIVVDVQRDFCEGGALAAANTGSLLHALQSFIEEARRRGVAVFFTQDWHPEKHSSFQTYGGPWPVHCVAETPGAELMPPVKAAAEDTIVHKGVGVDGAGYSGFDGTPLRQLLNQKGVSRVAVAGIATEYCVRATAMDARKAKFQTTILEDLIRAVKDEDVPEALAEMKEAGIKIGKSTKWLAGVAESRPRS